MAVQNFSYSTMKKSDIVNEVYQKIGFSKKEAADLVELVFDSIKDELAQNNKVKISGFGNFLVNKKKPRIGRNPKTGQKLTISGRRAITFRPSQVLRDLLNDDGT